MHSISCVGQGLKQTGAAGLIYMRVENYNYPNQSHVGYPVSCCMGMQEDVQFLLTYFLASIARKFRTRKLQAAAA